MRAQALQAQHGDRLIIERMDVTDPDGIAACAAAVERQVPCLNLLFNVAGLLHIPGARSVPFAAVAVYICTHSSNM